jgi:hypothetical protein
MGHVLGNIVLCKWGKASFAEKKAKSEDGGIDGNEFRECGKGPN